MWGEGYGGGAGQQKYDRLTIKTAILDAARLLDHYYCGWMSCMDITLKLNISHICEGEAEGGGARQHKYDIINIETAIVEASSSL